MIWLLLIAAILILFLGLVRIGTRSRAIFIRPDSLSDKQISATINLTRQIMRRTAPGSPAWERAAAKHKAAFDEQLRRGGNQPLDDIELTTGAPLSDH